MRVKVFVVSVLAFFAIVGSASAFVWHLSVSTARHESERLMRAVCEEEAECTGWAAARCTRISESRVDCVGAWWSPGYSIEEEEQCYLTLHWGVNYHGVVALKNRGPLKCFVEGS